MASCSVISFVQISAAVISLSCNDGGIGRVGHALGAGCGAHLETKDCNYGLRMDESRRAEVVKATLVEDLGAGLPPHSLAKVLASIQRQSLGGQAAHNSKHSPAAVQYLDLAV